MSTIVVLAIWTRIYRNRPISEDPCLLAQIAILPRRFPSPVGIHRTMTPPGTYTVGTLSIRHGVCSSMSPGGYREMTEVYIQ